MVTKIYGPQEEETRRWSRTDERVKELGKGKRNKGDKRGNGRENEKYK